jgi:hypothetical protein
VALTQARTVVEPKTDELSRVHVTVPRRVLDKLTAAKDALSHSHPNASDADVFEVGLDLIIERHAKRRGIGAKPRKPAAEKVAASSAPAALPAKRNRHVASAVWRAVWERDRAPYRGGNVAVALRG